MSLAVGFAIALLPLIIILLGIILFKQSGLRMGLIGWLVAVGLAVAYFKTDISIALSASAFGFLKSFGVSISVIATMYMIFLMKEVGALEIISGKIKSIVKGKEMQALYIGIAFGSFLTSLGVVTPSLFPPLLLAMGFTPFQSVAIAVLGYNATTSFALLSIPITITSQLGVDVIVLAFKITLFLPVVSVAIAFGILWLIGGKESMKKGMVPAILGGLVLAFSCLAFAAVDFYTNSQIIPISVIGVFAGLICMGFLQVYDRLFNKQKEGDADAKDEKKADSEAAQAGPAQEKPADDKTQPEKPGSDKPAPQKGKMPIAVAISPWIVLTICAIIISVSVVNTALNDAPGTLEKLTFYKAGSVTSNNVTKNVSAQVVDFNICAAIYTWIVISVIISLLFLRPTTGQLKKTTVFWAKRAWGPFLAYSIYFSIAYVMAWSCMHESGGMLIKNADYNDFNMNFILGAGLAAAFGVGYVYVAGSLGMLGAVIGGSEASSNVMFYGIQKTAAGNSGYNDKDFMTMYAAHATAGGVASAITPAKINNAVVTINAKPEIETQIMRKHIVIVLLLTIAIGVMTGIFVRFAF